MNRAQRRQRHKGKAPGWTPPEAPRNQFTVKLTEHRQDTPGGYIRSTILLRPEVEDRAAESDREYFNDHRHEVERVRPALPGELGGDVEWVQVIGLRPGVRARRAWVKS